MSSHGKPRHLFYLVIVAAVLIPALRIRDAETPTERAYRICGECGDSHQVDWSQRMDRNTPPVDRSEPVA